MKRPKKEVLFDECPFCHGTGLRYPALSKPTAVGMVGLTQRCRACDGAGRIARRFVPSGRPSLRVLSSD